MQSKLAVIGLALVLTSPCARLCAQAPDGMLTDKEVETLRDVAFEPERRIQAYQHILDDRERILVDTWKRGQGHAGQAGDLHDVIEQMGEIANELNDNLDEDAKNYRDVRKVLPKLIAAIERWSTSLRTPTPNEAYDVVRRLALDNLKDMRELAEQLGPDQDAYFKAHPAALQREKTRRGDPHAITPEGEPK